VNPSDVLRRVVGLAVPAGLLGLAAKGPRGTRAPAAGALALVWTAVYARYRRRGRHETAREYELLRSANWEAYTRHYNERVPTIAEEFDLWGPYHQHRHEMRYDLVAAAVRAHLRPGGRVLDLGCGAALVAERISDLPATYVGLDFPAHQVRFAAESFAARRVDLRTDFLRGDGAALPFPAASFDVVVLSEVIEHLLRPEVAVWEISRVLRPGGVFVMTTNNASEVPLVSPLRNPLAWLEKALGATRPNWISRRPWVWPDAVDPALLPSGSGPVYLPHTHHIYGQTRDLFARAGLETFEWSTFEFPPPQAATAASLERRGAVGRRAVDAIEAVATRTPLVRRLGCHLFMVARRTDAEIEPSPPPGVWPGPFSAPPPAD